MALVRLGNDLVFHILIGMTEGGWFCLLPWADSCWSVMFLMNNIILMHSYTRIFDHIMQDYQKSGVVRDPGSLSFSMSTLAINPQNYASLLARIARGSAIDDE